MVDVIEGISAWLHTNWPQVCVTVVVVAFYVSLDRISTPRIEESAGNSRFRSDSATKAIRAARLLIGLVGVLVLAVAWGVDLSGVLLVTTTALTLLGVALFATWSILSNVTAYFVLLFHPSFKRGNFIRVLDMDNYVEGYISELGLFNTKLVTESRSVIVYPNNLLLGRPMIVNPRDRLLGVGKIVPPVNEDENRNPAET